jgi:hypothetical protein
LEPSQNPLGKRIQLTLIHWPYLPVFTAAWIENNKRLTYFNKVRIFFRKLQSRFYQQQFKFNSEEDLKAGYIYIEHVNTLMRAAENNPARHAEYMEESFRTLRLIFDHFAKSGATLDSLGARFAASNETLVHAIRPFQDIDQKIKKNKQAWALAATKPLSTDNNLNNQKISSKMNIWNNQANILHAKLVQKFPDYLNTLKSKPLSLKEIRQYLKNDEAIIMCVSNKPFAL